MIPRLLFEYRGTTFHLGRHEVKVPGFHLVQPWLPTTHPQFFFIYTATLIYHLWSGIQLLAPGGDDVPALKYAHSVSSPIAWGIVSLVIGIGMYLSLHATTFGPARLFLAFGIVWCSFRFVLVSIAWFQGVPTGLALPNLALIVALHISQTREPPVNPVAAARKGTPT